MDETEFIELLRRAQNGDSVAKEQFCNEVNAELRRAAEAVVRRAHGGAQPTSLVNELYLKLFSVTDDRDYKNRRYFFGVAFNEMKRILRERRRRQSGVTKGGHLQRVSLDVALDAYADQVKEATGHDVERVHDALDLLRTQGTVLARQCEAIELHYFVGLKQPEVGKMLGLSVRQVARELEAGRRRLAIELKRG